MVVVVGPFDWEVMRCDCGVHSCVCMLGLTCWWPAVRSGGLGMACTLMCACHFSAHHMQSDGAQDLSVPCAMPLSSMQAAPGLLASTLNTDHLP